jgi:sugar phosphate permease
MQLPNARWFMVGLAFMGIIICYMDRSALAYAIHPLESTFHLNNAQFGMLSSVFGIGYLVMVFIGGITVDKYGAHLVWGISAFIWSVATLLIGFSTGLGMLLILRLMVGVSEGPSFPAITRAVTDWLPMHERSRALAFSLAAVPFASVIGAPLSTHLVYYYGWQFMFVMLGALGIIWALIWLVVFRNKPEQFKLITASELSHIQVRPQTVVELAQEHNSSWKFILFNHSFLINNYAFFAFGYLLFFGITWLPGYLEQSFHLKLTQVELFLILPWLLATCSIITVGFISDKLWQNTRSLRISRSLIIGLCMVLSALAFIPAVISHSLVLSIICISLAIALGLAPNSCFYALNADLAPDKAATSLGVMDVFLALAGIIAPTITGISAKLTGNFNSAIIIMLMLNLSSGVLLLFIQNPDKDLRSHLKLTI